MTDIVPEIRKDIADVAEPISKLVNDIDQAGCELMRLRVELRVRTQTIEFWNNADIVDQPRLTRNAFRLGYKEGWRGRETTPNPFHHRAHRNAFERGYKVGAKLSLRMIDALLAEG